MNGSRPGYTFGLRGYCLSTADSETSTDTHISSLFLLVGEVFRQTARVPDRSTEIHRFPGKVFQPKLQQFTSLQADKLFFQIDPQTHRFPGIPFSQTVFQTDPHTHTQSSMHTFQSDRFPGTQPVFQIDLTVDRNFTTD